MENEKWATVGGSPFFTTKSESHSVQLFPESTIYGIWHNLVKEKMQITYLRPTASWAKTSKTYSAPNRDSKTSDYNLGTFFTYDHQHYKTLQEFADSLSARENEIVIYGRPNDMAEMAIVTSGEVHRRTEFFPYPEDQTLHCLDIDGWAISEAVRDQTQVKFGDTASMGALVDQMLRNEGFGIFADASKVIVFTSSMWGLQQLNCHVYIETSEPVRVEAMREFATALAKVNQRTVFDPAVYKAVQPQFFTAPTCTNFVDPLGGKRVWYRQGDNDTVPLQDFQALVNTTLQQADWNPTSANQNQPSISSGWLNTIQDYVGDERGINEPAFRAAAQLVQAAGRQHVIAHINDYAQQLYDAVWKTLGSKDGTRGQSAKDKQTYDIARFRQYLKSATEKNFGDEIDTLMATVRTAISAGDLEKLIETPTLAVMNQIRAQYPAKWLVLEKEISASKIVPLGKLNKLLSHSHSSTDSVEGGGTEGFSENDIIDTVLAQYDYIRDTLGNKFASIPGNGDGGYRMMRVDGSLLDVFFVDGLRLSGNQVSPQFGKKVLSKLMGTETRAVQSSFREERIGLRVTPESQLPDTPTWVNLGLQSDGIFKSAKITPEGVAICSHRDSDVMWTHGTHPLHVATNEAIFERFGESPDLTDYIMETLPRFIGLDEDSLLKTLMWCCSVFADKTLAYIAEIVGPSSSGKSTAADLLKDLLDPSGMEMGIGADRTLFTGATDDFIADIEKRHVTIIDNVSKLSSKEQDVLCTICTGMRKPERILYTQQHMERVVRRHLVFTTLAPVVTREDLRSRVVSIPVFKPPYDKRFTEKWVQEKPFLVAALLQLTGKTLKLYNDSEDKPYDIESRDVFLACVHSAITKKNKVYYEFVREFRLSEAYDAVYDSSFIRMFAAYLDDEFGETGAAEFTTRGLHTRLKKWAAMNAGKEFGDYTVDMNSVPATGRGLGWELTKGVGIISRATDWKYQGYVKRSNGKKYVFQKKNPLDNLEALL